MPQLRFCFALLFNANKDAVVLLCALEIQTAFALEGKMTYIEFFDKTASENIAACLTYAPERVIYIGYGAKTMRKHIENYERVFRARGEQIDFLYKTVSKSNLDNAVSLLTEIVETYDDCVFDITGGEEILLLALGVVYAQHPNKNIQIHKINIRNNTVYDCDKDGTTIYQDTPTLSIEENIRIYGGDVVYGAIGEEKTYKWDLNADFVNDVERMWRICKEDVRFWNTQIGVFEAAETMGRVSEDGLTTTASRAAVDYHLQQHRAKYKMAKGIIGRLLQEGLLTHFDDDETTITIGYKDKQVKKCLTKAGQALEMKVYVTAKNILDDEGLPVYDDALNGVVIDWDGEVHDEQAEETYDTENEIDVLLMHDIIPVFVSCKNGIVTSEELYKLDTVAKRFGGKYAKKVLIATSVDSSGKTAGKYLRQRAIDMGIRLIENIQLLDEETLVRKMKNMWNT